MIQTIREQTESEALTIKRDKTKERAENRKTSGRTDKLNNNLGRHKNAISEMTADCPHQQNSKRDAESTTNTKRKKRTNEEKTDRKKRDRNKPEQGTPHWKESCNQLWADRHIRNAQNEGK